MSDLKPCPCCGHRAELCEESTDYGDWWTIRCIDCDLMIEGSCRQKVIDAWQRRRTDGMKAAQIERDANLIAAAPQMLEALRLIAKLDYKKAATNLSAFNAVNIAKKAIREATGEVV